jgi:hypothetical protein
MAAAEDFSNRTPIANYRDRFDHLALRDRLAIIRRGFGQARPGGRKACRAGTEPNTLRRSQIAQSR